MNEIEELKQENEDLKKELKETKQLLEKSINETCLYCGKYKREYDGACEGCEWEALKW